MLAIFSKELNNYLNSLIAYIVISLFLIFTGLVLWVFPDTNILDYGYAEMNTFFSMTPYILIFIVPAITMRLLAEEYKSGTIEFLLTKPLTTQSLVGGKFLGAWLVIFLAIIPTVFYYYSIKNIGNPIGNIDTGAVIGSYFGLILLAGVFTAIGLFSSSLTDNQVIAFISGAFLCYFLYDGLHQLSGIFSGQVAYFVDYLSLQNHYNSLGRGVLDTRNLIYLVSASFLFLFFAAFQINRKRK